MNSKNVQVIFTCFLCGQKMRNKSGYRKHMKFCVFINDNRMRLFPCFLCGEELENKTKYKKHWEMCIFNGNSGRKKLRNKQKSDFLPLINCGCCETNFNSTVEYDAHKEMGICIVDHPVKIELKCKEDSRATAEVCQSSIEMPAISDEITTLNDISDFGTIVRGRSNIKYINSNEPNNVTLYLTCGSCDTIFNNAVEYDAHVKMGICTVDHPVKIELMQEDREATAAVCAEAAIEAPNKMIATSADISKFGESFLNLKKFRCKICGKGFSQKVHLNVHIVTVHEKVKKSKCDICYKGFGSKNYLKIHIATVHEKVKNFKCDICGREFFGKSHLSRHKMALHEKVKNFKCNICGREFFGKIHLSRHKMALHEKVKNFKCNICDREFFRQSHLNRHKIAVHEKVKKFKCDICCKKFGHKRSLKAHMGDSPILAHCLLRSTQF